jgi:SPP1 family predicted phage head-tail adaptor
MMGDYIVDLITVTHSNDVTVVVTETSRTVYADKKSVTRAEFYQGIANDLNLNAVFEVHSMEYEDEQKLRHEGNDYLIIRTYSKDDEKIELICQAYHDVQTNFAKLRDTVEIWHRTFILNSMNEETPVVALLYTVMAEIEFQGGGTSELDDIIETSHNAVVKIVYREGMREDMFLMIGGKRWNIRYMEDPYNRHETLILTVERVVP